MSGRLIKPPPTDGKELVRSFEQRIRQLETKQTMRIGDWVVHSDDDGRLLATKPGEVNDVGNPIIEAVDLGALRGFVTDAEVAQAVSGGTTSSLSVATSTQIGRDAATGNAQYTADNAQALAVALDAKLNAGVNGYVFSDTFDRDQANDLGSGWLRTAQSGGPGVWGTGGDGLARSLTVTGAQAQWWEDTWQTPCNTDSMIVSTTIDGHVLYGGGKSSEHRLHVRSTIDGAHKLYAIIDGEFVTMGYNKGAGDVTVIPRHQTPVADGDSWALIAINAADPTYVLLRNGVSIDTWTDFGHVYPINAAHRYGGMLNMAGVTTTYWFTYQIDAPRLQVFNFADRV